MSPTSCLSYVEWVLLTPVGLGPLTPTCSPLSEIAGAGGCSVPGFPNIP